METADELDVVVALLQRMSLEDAGRWLATPNLDLDGATPDEAIQGGRKVDVLRLVMIWAFAERSPSAAA